MTITGNEINWTYSFWAQQLQSSFERHFWVSPDKSANSNPELVNKTGIYKDSVGATNLWPDYQLRCNFPIALTVVSNQASILVWKLRIPITRLFRL